MKFKKGQKLKIYQDPLTEKKLEGTATLITRISSYQDTELWLVHFNSDSPGYYCQRQIKL